jgi:hypothetical protein
VRLKIHYKSTTSTRKNSSILIQRLENDTSFHLQDFTFKGKNRQVPNEIPDANFLEKKYSSAKTKQICAGPEASSRNANKNPWRRRKPKSTGAQRPRKLNPGRVLCAQKEITRPALEKSQARSVTQRPDRGSAHRTKTGMDRVQSKERERSSSAAETRTKSDRHLC